LQITSTRHATKGDSDFGVAAVSNTSSYILFIVDYRTSKIGNGMS
jgi:hypothetical protein